MSGTAKEAERAQELRRRAAQGDKTAEQALQEGDNTPGPSRTVPHDVNQQDEPTGERP